jgi:hypothetical protein
MKKLIASIVTAAGTLLLPAPAPAAIIVELLPATSHVAVGGSTDVQMRISGLDEEILSAFDINLLFDASIVENSDVLFSGEGALGGILDSYFFPDIQPGNTDVLGGSWLDDGGLTGLPQPDDFIVLTFTFKGIADGFSLLDLGGDVNFERNFVGLRAESLAVQIVGACISVGEGQCSSVPEPSALSLLGLTLGMASIVGLRRRRAR